MITKQQFIDEYVNRRESMNMTDSIGKLYDDHVAPILREDEGLRKDFEEAVAVALSNRNRIEELEEEIGRILENL